MRPAVEVLEAVLLERGGAPLHFLLAHLAFAVHPSAEALRWISVLCAVAAVPVTFDLGRRLAGPLSGLVAAAVVAGSTALAVYGSFGRMYALFILAAAVAGDLFVRAVQLRTPGAVALAALGAWLLPATHPYGALPAAAMLVAAALLWRRTTWRPAVPVAAAAVASLPFLVADLRLAERAEVGEDGRSLAGPGEAWSELVAALSAFAGGDGIPFVALTGVALVGLVALARSQTAFVALASTIFVPPLLFLVLSAGSAPDLSPRHLFYGLPLWAAAIGAGAAWMRERLPPRLGLALALGVIALALLSPGSALRDPRELGLLPEAVSGEVAPRDGDVLFPYAVPFLDELDRVRGALSLPQGPAAAIVETLEHSGQTVPAVVVARPEAGRWVISRRSGPFSRGGALRAAAEELIRARRPLELDWWYELVVPELCEAAARLGSRCPR